MLRNSKLIRLLPIYIYPLILLYSFAFLLEYLVISPWMPTLEATKIDALIIIKKLDISYDSYCQPFNDFE